MAGKTMPGLLLVFGKLPTTILVSVSQMIPPKVIHQKTKRLAMRVLPNKQKLWRQTR